MLHCFLETLNFEFRVRNFAIVALFALNFQQFWNLSLGFGVGKFCEGTPLMEGVWEDEGSAVLLEACFRKTLSWPLKKTTTPMMTKSVHLEKSLELFMKRT